MSTQTKNPSVVRVLAIVIGLIGIAIAALSAIGPAYTDVQRSISLRATPQQTFDFISDLNNFHQWFGLTELDSTLEYNISGNVGEGQSYQWKGNERVGEGEIVIVKADPHRLIEMTMTYTAPWEAEGQYLFNLSPDNSITEVSWRFRAKNGYFNRIQLIFFKLEPMIGDDLDKRLGQLREVFNAQK